MKRYVVTYSIPRSADSAGEFDAIQLGCDRYNVRPTYAGCDGCSLYYNFIGSRGALRKLLGAIFLDKGDTFIAREHYWFDDLVHVL